MTRVHPWKWRCQHDDLTGCHRTARYHHDRFVCVWDLNTPYTDAFRIGFYLFSVMGLVAAVLVLGRQPFEGYDPTPGTP